MVLASKADFSLVNSSNQCTAHIESPNSFRRAVSQLSDDIRRAHIDAYNDLYRAQIGLKRIPMHLKTILLLIKIGDEDSINTSLPNLLKKSENIVNESLTILKNPKKSIEQANDLINELDSLIPIISSDTQVILQIHDLKTQWILLTHLITQLSNQAEKTSNHFLLQFNWILQEFLRSDIPFIDSYRNLLIHLLQPKVIEIDQTIDLLQIISETYVDISKEYTNEKMTDNSHIIPLSNENDRKELIKQYRYELPIQAVKFARLALRRHDEFIKRNDIRQADYDKFLEMSRDELNFLLSIDHK
jgi:hypothetical protein